MTVLDQLREVGLPMTTRYAPVELKDDAGVPFMQRRYVSWTTDTVKADAARELGAVVVAYRSTDDRFSGYEVSVGVVE